ncbi:MAG: PPC domain-containing protein, partial [Planctomycetaceae bacterium]|nr:PPC domain-containing protein [Planctomycetaceae bacterium]
MCLSPGPRSFLVGLLRWLGRCCFLNGRRMHHRGKAGETAADLEFCHGGRCAKSLILAPLRVAAKHAGDRLTNGLGCLAFERLEERVLLSTFNVAVSPQDVVTAAHGDWFEQASSISTANRVDTYAFTLAQAAGVFIDVDARDIGLSNLDSRVTLQRSNGTQIATNDDGFDFEGINPVDGRSRDSSLYADLAAGSYQVRVEGFSGVSTGDYLLRMLFDTTYSTTVPVFNSLPGAAAA